MKKALIVGITGQDGSYLAEFLLAKGYAVGRVWPASRLSHPPQYARDSAFKRTIPDAWK